MGGVVSLTRIGLDARDIHLYGRLSGPLNDQVLRRVRIEESVQRYSTYGSGKIPLLLFIGKVSGFCLSVQKSRKALSAVSASFLFDGRIVCRGVELPSELFFRLDTGGPRSSIPK